MPIVLPKGKNFWPAQGVELTTPQVVSLYESGFAGCLPEPEIKEQLLSELPWPDGEKVSETFGLMGSGEGKLSLPYLAAWKHWPKAWPSPGQTTGDCVSKGAKNAAFVLIGVECELNQPDPVTGIFEGWPEVSAEGEEHGVVASEPQYGYRGHTGQGASCGRLVKYMTDVGGIFLRKNYPELGIDLTRYKASIGINWGRSGPPEAVNAEGRKHQIRSATLARTHEIVRDFHANGYPMWACSGLGWSSSRDEWGFSRQSGSWAHSWITMAYDDRENTKRKYGHPLALYNHDWGRWNRGGRDIFESAQLVPPDLKELWIRLGIVNPQTGNILIPEGSMWIDARLLNRCECWIPSNVNGWPSKSIPFW